MRLQKLTGLERDKLRAEFDALMATIEDLEDILARVERRMEIITSELIDVKERFGDERRSDIEFSSADVRMEDLIADEQVIVSISHAGYIKRTRLADYRSQSRGGVGSKGANNTGRRFRREHFRGYQPQLAAHIHSQRPLLLDSDL